MESVPRGEKQWQDWAQDFVNWEDLRTTKANTRLPYASNLQVEDVEDSTFSLVHIQNQEGDELIALKE